MASLIKLQSSDGQIFPVDTEIARRSITIKTMMEDLGLEDKEEESVPLPNVSSDILKKVIEWMTYHKDDSAPQPIKEDTEDDDDAWKEKEPLEIGSWDKEFFESLHLDNKFEVLKASNYLNIKGLMDIGCMTISNIIKENTIEDVRKMFNIVNDFTPEELGKVREENKWATEEKTAESK